MRERVEFDYEISDERLIAWSQMPIIDRLQMLDNIRQFTLAVRRAPTVVERAQTENPLLELPR